MSEEEIAALPVIPMCEVQKHNTPEDGWMIIRGLVFDLTAFLPKHRGLLHKVRFQLYTFI